MINLLIFFNYIIYVFGQSSVSLTARKSNMSGGVKFSALSKIQTFHETWLKGIVAKRYAISIMGLVP